MVSSDCICQAYLTTRRLRQIIAAQTGTESVLPTAVLPMPRPVAPATASTANTDQVSWATTSGSNEHRGRQARRLATVLARGTREEQLAADVNCFPQAAVA